MKDMKAGRRPGRIMPDWRVKHGMMSGHSARFLHLKKEKKRKKNQTPYQSNSRTCQYSACL